MGVNEKDRPEAAIGVEIDRGLRTLADRSGVAMLKLHVFQHARGA
jgi:hypothetical protein